MDVGLLLARAAERGAELGMRLVRIGADVVAWLGAGREAAGEAAAPEMVAEPGAGGGLREQAELAEQPVAMEQRDGGQGATGPGVHAVADGLFATLPTRNSSAVQYARWRRLDPSSQLCDGNVKCGIQAELCCSGGICSGCGLCARHPRLLVCQLYSRRNPPCATAFSPKLVSSPKPAPSGTRADGCSGAQRARTRTAATPTSYGGSAVQERRELDGSAWSMALTGQRQMPP